jgi:predicted HTH domain antitoxin
MRQHDTRTEAALYWTAVSLIVCEGLSIEKAAERLGVDAEDLTDILHRRQSLRPYAPTPPVGRAVISTHS